MIKMTQYNLVAENPESTVVSKYQQIFRKEINYQSEADLEKAFIGPYGVRPQYLPKLQQAVAVLPWGHKTPENIIQNSTVLKSVYSS